MAEGESYEKSAKTEKKEKDIYSEKDKIQLLLSEEVRSRDLEKCTKIGRVTIRELKADLLSAAAEAQNVCRVTLPDPKEKAINYLYKHGILTLLENLIIKIVHERPDQPLRTMLEQVQKHDATSRGPDVPEPNVPE